jgi:signal peptidase I
VTAPASLTRRDPDPVREAARALLTRAVRGRRERGGPWGEAVLGEFDQTRGRWEAVRWAAGGVRAVLRERRRIGLGRELPRSERLARRVAVFAALTLLVTIVVRLWLVQLVYIPSGGMEPTYQVGDRVAIDKISYRLTGLEHGDLVRYRAEGERNFLKRVVGLPGDTIACSAGRVLRNGVALDEPYLPPGPDGTTDCAATTVPAEHVFVLGDQRAVSVDSRQLGPVPVAAVNGRALGVVWPLRR